MRWAALDDVETQGRDVLVSMSDTEMEWWIQVRLGVVSTGTGARSDANLFLRSRAGSPVLDLLSGALPANDAAAELEVSVPGADWASHPPFDLGPPTGGADIPGADLLVQHAKRGSVVGTIHYWERYCNGRLVERVPGIVPGSDVVVENTFESMVASLRSPGPLDATGGARVRGRSTSSVLVLAGIYADDSLRAYLAGRTAVNMQLCALATSTRSPAWRLAVGRGML
ncbi:MAG TPA: hypothetical protein PK020_14175 [Ilumatobacteraceae bacterium]|nr:hypothetical protein [Ilumatobacteraceae bacterium]